MVAYCFAGGIRASLWTDVAQSIVMFVAMVILCFVAIEESGGFDSMWTTLGQRPALTDWQPVNLPWGFTLFAPAGLSQALVLLDSHTSWSVRWL